MMLVEGRLLDEASLIEAAKAGDVSAYEELVRAHQEVALRVAFLVARDADEAQDVTQDAFINAYRALDRFDSGRPFRPWILTIVRNLARNRRRAAGRRAHLQLRLAAIETVDEGARSPEVTAITLAESQEVLVAVDRLPERMRAVVGLRYLVGLSEQETAETLAIPIGTVKSRTARALARLAADLGTSLEEVSG